MKMRISRLFLKAGRKDVDQTDAVVGCKNVLDQEVLDVTKVMDVLALMEVLERYLARRHRRCHSQPKRC